MTTRSGGARSRALGTEIRKIRESLKWGLHVVAKPTGLSPATLSRIETGQRECKPEELVSILTVLGVKGADRERLLRLTRDTSRAAWLGLGEDGTFRFTAMTSYEDDAVRMQDVEPMLIPGLLQSAPYARAVLTAGNSANIEAAVQARLLRQANLSRPSLQGYTAIMDESALHRPIGGPSVMAHQLAHLLNLASWDRVSIRVVPFDVGMYLGLDGRFTIFELPRKVRVVYFDGHGSGAFFEGSLTDSFRHTLRSIEQDALSQEDSTELIKEYLERWQRE
jgi:transcriptional regulator with XRE-family HTH domain